MTPRDLQDVLRQIHEVADLELALAALYSACGERFPEDRNLWLVIGHQEELHAQFIAKLADLICARQQEFGFGRPFDSTAIKSIHSSVAGYTDQVRTGRLDRQYALFMARDVENSVVEANYREIVTSDNLEFRQTIDLIAKDTLAHKNLFAAKGAKIKA